VTGPSAAWDNSLICHCGKRGWSELSDAERAYRIMRSRAKRRDKSPRVDQLKAYLCGTGSGLYHVGHNRRAAS
jgi:hypothetical protein